MSKHAALTWSFLLGILVLRLGGCSNAGTKPASDAATDTPATSTGGEGSGGREGSGGTAGIDASGAGASNDAQAVGAGGRTGLGGSAGIVGGGGLGGGKGGVGTGGGGAVDASQTGGAGGKSAADGAAGAGVAGMGGAGDASNSSGGSGGRDATGTSAAVCPSTIPANGESCTTGLQCAWGDQPLFSCRTLGFCYNSQWSTSGPPPNCGPDPACPATPSDLAACPANRNLHCIYPDASTCSCADCCNLQRCMASCDAPGTRYVFACGGPPAMPAGCPSVVPNQGTACDLPSGTICHNTCDIKVTCQAGVWRWNTQPCATGSGGVCASPDTPIATPTGDRSIADIRVGDLVYSIDHGAVRPVPVVRVRRQIVQNHRVVRVTTTDERVLEISAPHPTADGRRFGDLVANGSLDGHKLESVEVVPYRHPFTYDILPGSDTGFYFAGGMLIGSTLP